MSLLIFPNLRKCRGITTLRLHGFFRGCFPVVRAPHAHPHVHDHNPEIYFAATENRGDIVIEVQMDDETFTVESPFAVFIPAGVKHCFTVLKCDSPNYVFGMHIMDYEEA